MKYEIIFEEKKHVHILQIYIKSHLCSILFNEIQYHKI